MFGQSIIQRRIQQKFDAEIKRLGNDVESITILVGSKNGVSRVSYIKNGNTLTLDVLDAKDDDAVKFAYLFVTLNTLKGMK